MQYSRRRVLGLTLAALGMHIVGARAAAPVSIKVYKDLSCGCCAGWIEHIQQHGFAATVIDTTSMHTIKARLRVPEDLASCHTAEVGGYVIEGHVPSDAILRLLKTRPQAIGLSAPGMPIGSPGMEGGMPEDYEVVLLGTNGGSSLGRYKGSKPI